MTLGIEDVLFKAEKEDYGETYANDYFAQYQMYVEMADRISTRRQSANSFFLSINTALVAVVAYVQLGQDSGTSAAYYWLVSVSGMVLCYAWYRLIRSYKDLNSGKFKVIHALEQRLPAAPYDAEWISLGKGKNSDLYLPFTRIEMAVPWIFLVLHLSVLVQVFPYEKLAQTTPIEKVEPVLSK